ncbi:mannitol-1-phosphate 5-dehydrogenase [Fundicoccus culcitae]|uniref:Mannitol-1-phosphate 5-dehydrogenase n=1 Tax=Fundicoccus culcitae TaxID=2969821 RepID=A0ABY5P9X2_9LACT|nr:mannitol-1-phosphate 5-dehydrogenase [Fundicoccus culcitae]UUX35464.1 mannitol-1-phosphate 5-dehydrogenase [Fundicoccus culcitae]
MKAVHFGAGNIGRGFIGEILFKNNIEIVFVDINKTIIDALNEKGEYDIALAAPEAETIHVENVRGVNNETEAEKVAEEIADADIVTTAIGPNILKFIAPLIANGLRQRLENGNHQPLDVIACENMIGGSQQLKTYVYDSLTAEEIEQLEAFIGFPNAAVDRIIPMQSHDDPLFVSVEPFSEWVIDESQMKNVDLKLEGVEYEPSLEPFIERKLLSVNTGHATVAYTAKMYGYKTIKDAITDERVLSQLQNVLQETGQLLITKWDFDPAVHADYQATIINRFKNPYISDDVVRVGRTPIRKLGYNERFILPIRELAERKLSYHYLVDTVGMIFHYDDPADNESVQLQQMLQTQPLEDVIKEVTGLEDATLINEIKASVEKYNTL